eukprot:12080-Chlamydomonas_euryale.AAC.1
MEVCMRAFERSPACMEVDAAVATRHTCTSIARELNEQHVQHACIAVPSGSSRMLGCEAYCMHGASSPVPLVLQKRRWNKEAQKREMPPPHP